MSSFHSIIDKITSDPSEKNILELIDHSNSMSDEEIVELANIYAESGITIQRNSSKTKVDIASTGGPSSLSTILTPLILKSLGAEIPKLGVPGRPAGGIDILYQLQGYNINPNPIELEKWLDHSKYVHFIGNDLYTPLDRKVFEIRKKHNYLNIPQLVIASILSKKIAINLTHAGLDIRVSPFGNFGSNWNNAKANGRRFIKASGLIGINTKCFLTNGSVPYQPYIGRGEALLGIYNLFELPEINNSLHKHLEECYAMAMSVLKSQEFCLPDKKLLKQFFKENITIQGSNYKIFTDKAKQVEVDHRYIITSNSSGYIKFDLNQIRQAIVHIQKKEATNFNLFPDPCGIILKKSNSDIVVKGEIILSFRCIKRHLNEFRKMLSAGFIISPQRYIQNNYEEII
ncbi:hypothetical protein [Christiangramia crocea]|uniref:Thymidine phosphorylase n=1 Tax=Christiangramia crocea TaxID=2904124 RepID=A0A9X1UUQ9_9FLAO|nr:hypothetical protein [Gramella crocea]MCG9970732.1 hypothetical protein [Gramella crocea]